MKTILFLIPLALFLGFVGLGAFLWSLRSGQYEDLEGAGLRILIDDDDKPIIDEKDKQDDAQKKSEIMQDDKSID
ncbi:Type cbb3 cytochrome oxidase biogenesis protein CcoS, involved in heme b insertion [hydrothermal vent metagenome]|uniref:Type cbb3 cytochrome oxidase biogenesis protein CcoS, involved in heme b insertion n=1 Tax=hydrothermal vent metagenome TaxID=652676 RepID=A0A3B0VTH1_9ZZZZ